MSLWKPENWIDTQSRSVVSVPVFYLLCWFPCCSDEHWVTRLSICVGKSVNNRHQHTHEKLDLGGMPPRICHCVHLGTKRNVGSCFRSVIPSYSFTRSGFRKCCSRDPAMIFEPLEWNLTSAPKTKLIQFQKNQIRPSFHQVEVLELTYVIPRRHNPTFFPDSSDRASNNFNSNLTIGGFPFHLSYDRSQQEF